MKVDADKSRYHEDPAASKEFDRHELRRARYILRRLQFLEAQIETSGGLTDGGRGNGGAAHAEWEVEALEWLLGPDGIGFLETTGDEK